jgi:hypothetical protein
MGHRGTKERHLLPSWRAAQTRSLPVEASTSHLLLLVARPSIASMRRHSAKGVSTRDRLGYARTTTPVTTRRSSATLTAIGWKRCYASDSSSFSTSWASTSNATSLSEREPQTTRLLHGADSRESSGRDRFEGLSSRVDGEEHPRRDHRRCAPAHGVHSRAPVRSARGSTRPNVGSRSHRLEGLSFRPMRKRRSARDRRPSPSRSRFNQTQRWVAFSSVGGVRFAQCANGAS